MKLTLKDRVLILNTVLPQFDTRKNMELKIAIAGRIAIPESDQQRIVVKDLGGGQLNIGFTDADAITATTDFALSDAELAYLKQRVDFIDQNGMFSEFTMPTYVKVLDEPYADPNYGQPLPTVQDPEPEAVEEPTPEAETEEPETVREILSEDGTRLYIGPEADRVE